VPQAHTKQFGTIDYREEDAVEFPLGLPAFEHERRFLPLARSETRPLVFLQSLSSPDLCFVTLPLLLADPDYRLAVSAEDLRILGLVDVLQREGQPAVGRDVDVLVIMSVTNSRPTANLLAPVVINISSRGNGKPSVAVQAVRADSDYSHEHAWEAHAC